MLRKQIDDLEMAIQSARYEQDGGRYTVKQIEKTRKTLQTRLEKLNQKEKKDQVVTFEELQAMFDAGYKFYPNQAIGKDKIWYGDMIYADYNGDGIYGNDDDRDF